MKTKTYLFSFFLVCFISLFTIEAQADTPYRKINTGCGKWTKSWFADEFNDPMYDKPYLQTELKSKISNYTWRFFYIQYFIYNGHKVFQITLCSNQQNINIESSDVTIKIKSRNGSISTFKEIVSGGQILIMDNEATRFANAITKGYYSLAVNFHWYADDYGQNSTWSFPCTNETSNFYGALKFLK